MFTVPGIAARLVVVVHNWVVIYIEKAIVITRAQVLTVLGLPHSINVTVVLATLDALSVPSKATCLCCPLHILSFAHTIRSVFFIGYVKILLLVRSTACADVFAV